MMIAVASLMRLLSAMRLSRKGSRRRTAMLKSVLWRVPGVAVRLHAECEFLIA